MDMSTFKTMQEAAAAIGSATKYIGAANLELGKVALPAVRSAVGNVPKAVEKTLDQARHGQSADERKHAAVTLGVGVIAVVGLTVATVVHFSHKIHKSRMLRAQKRQVAAALAREKQIDETIASAVALRPASSLEHDASGDGLSFAKEPGCFAILTYEPDVAADDPSAYRDVYVGASAPMLEGVRKQLDGKGNLYVHADMSYGRPVYVAFFPCDVSELLDERARLVKALGADDSYNMVASATMLD